MDELNREAEEETYQRRLFRWGSMCEGESKRKTACLKGFLCVI